MPPSPQAPCSYTGCPGDRNLHVCQIDGCEYVLCHLCCIMKGEVEGKYLCPLHCGLSPHPPFTPVTLASVRAPSSSSLPSKGSHGSSAPDPTGVNEVIVLGHSSGDDSDNFPHPPPPPCSYSGCVGGRYLYDCQFAGCTKSVCQPCCTSKGGLEGELLCPIHYRWSP